MKQTFGNVTLGFEIEAKDASPKLMDQVHGGRIVHLTGQPSPLEKADGIATKAPGFPLSVFTADCIPLLFFSNTGNGPVAAVHCGWRGALAQIAANAVRAMASANLHVMVGPCILKCCFEVKEDLIKEFSKKGEDITPFLEKRQGAIYFDLVQYTIQRQLQGVTVHTDFLRCTMCSKPELPSYRRNKSTDPRIRSWIVKAP